MSCPTVEQLAALASGEPVDELLAHVEACAKCAAIAGDQRFVRQLAQQMAVPRLSPLHRAKLQLVYDDVDPDAPLLPKVKLAPDHRARLAAETMARADTTEVRIGGGSRRRRWSYVIGGLAAAAAVATVLVARHRPSASASTPASASASASAGASASAPASAIASASATTAAVAHEWKPPVAPAQPAVPAPASPATAPMIRDHATAQAPAKAASPEPIAVSKVAAKVTGESDADYTRLGNGVVLRDGTISIDARDRAPVAVAVGDTKLRVHNAHVEIKAAHGVIVSAHSFAGSVERTSPESKAVIQSGEEWAPTPREAALAAFRIGWRALHEGRNADALAAFERASDPVVSEESSFWAAVAAQRAGNKDEASQRFRAFLDAYPHSTRADAARSALAN